jgi:hypothetical protein
MWSSIVAESISAPQKHCDRPPAAIHEKPLARPA